MFTKVLASVKAFFGVDTLPQKDGKSCLTEDMRKQLQDKWGDKFLETFEKDLKEFEENGDDKSAEVDEYKKKLETMDKEFQAYKDNASKKEAAAAKEKKELEDKVKKLEKDPVKENAEEIDPKKEGGKEVAFKADMSYQHNKVLQAFFEGKGAAYSGDDTVNTSELKTEFGKYVSGDKLGILRMLTQDIDCVKHMTTVITDKTEWRASQAMITSVLQQFTPKWTPKGTTKFTPLKIKNFKLKINVPIIPSDIMEDVLGYLYDENLSPKDMPIVKYIIEQLIMPVINEEREKILATGKYVEFKPSADGTAGDDAANSLDGYVTILNELKKANKQIGGWLLDGIDLSAATNKQVVTYFEQACDSLSPLFKNKKLPIICDPDLVLKYNRGYREMYPNTKNQDGQNMEVDFTNKYFIPIAGMAGTGCFFITPKENWKHLLSRDPKGMNLRMAEHDYTVKIYGEWWESTGFAMAEALFAHVAPASQLSEHTEEDTGNTGGL
ncbi:MAG: hypothetical protein RR837_02580 [Bacteroidales bacterium]